MLGYKLLLTRIIPFTMLLCFVCFGISLIFNINDLTYLKTIQIDGKTLYAFDFEHYIGNLNINIFQRATNQFIDINAFNSIMARWEELWADGYDVGDIVISIINGITFLINAIIIIPNVIIIILKIIAGILLTGLSLIGINIGNQNSLILNGLNSFIDLTPIPQIYTWL